MLKIDRLQILGAVTKQKFVAIFAIDLKERRNTSEIIIWQSNVPLPIGSSGRCTRERIFVTTGAPKVMFGTKCPCSLVKRYGTQL